MVGSLYNYLRPAQLSGLLGLKSRQTAHVLGTLEAVGFDLPTDQCGARLVHPDLAAAVCDARSEGRELRTLLTNPELKQFLRRGRAAELDPLELLIELSAEVSIVREVGGTLAEGARLALPNNWRAPDWASLSLPDPRSDL